MSIYCLDGNFIAEEKATISVHDLSLLRGYGVFDFLRSYNGHPFQLQAHIDRLARSAQLVGLSLPVSCEEIFRLTMETIAHNNHQEYQIRLVITGGESLGGFLPERGAARLIIMVSPLHPLPEQWYSNGVKVTTCRTSRFLPGAKTTNYIPAILAMQEATARGAVESIYLDAGGFLQEGTTSNFFAFFGSTLVTPPSSRILPGITREAVLDLAQGEFNIEIRPIHQDEIRLMDEAVITASNKEILPVCAINSEQISQKVGLHSKKLMQLFKSFTRKYQG
ncbi:aminotransferase class IV [Desulfotalea psychrophila]|nr:aminotransferase class IV [Desulfotalea psychrophila]